MRSRSAFLAAVIVLCFILGGYGGIFNATESPLLNFVKTESRAAAERTADSGDILVSDGAAPQADTSTVTMRDIETFLKDKNAHYPLSDEFIERYQQTSGGYLDNARQTGVEVNKQKHEPDQKWHFFDSWLYPSIEDGSITWDASARSRVYIGLKCPELLLWIFEASGVDPVKVKAAKDVAEQGKAAGTNVGTIASNMRACVPWEDIASAILNQEYTTQEVTVSAGDGFTVTGISNEHRVGSIVTFTVNVTDETKEIAEVRVNNEILTASSGTTYKFTMPDEAVVIDVVLQDMPARVVLSKQKLTLTVGESATLTADVFPGGATENASWSVVGAAGIVGIAPDGNKVTVNALGKGTATVKVTFGMALSAECTVTVKEQGSPAQNSFIYSVKGDLGTGKRTKAISSAEDLFKLLQSFAVGEEIITSVGSVEVIAGGGYGGSGATQWYLGNVIKIGTTSAIGSMTLDLNVAVSRIIITGYVADVGCKIQVGDADSTDWTEAANDNKTTTVTCSDAVAASKANIDDGKISTITIDFESTDCLKIAIANKKPLYIASIEFVLSTDTAR